VRNRTLAPYAWSSPFMTGRLCLVSPRCDDAVGAVEDGAVGGVLMGANPKMGGLGVLGCAGCSCGITAVARCVWA
jgi:hypothetical protein